MSALDERLTREVLTLLRRSAVKNIGFVAAGITISGKSYAHLAGFIESGVLPIKIDPTLEHPGAYFPRNDGDDPNTLKFKKYPPFHDALVVHELTHAAIDLLDLPKQIVIPRSYESTFSTRGLHRTENEGIAYIAQFLYCRMTNQPYTSLTEEQLARKPRLQHLARVADAIAGRILASGTKFYQVSEDEIRWMRNAVGQHPVYRAHRNEPSPSDGFRMDFDPD